VGRKNAASNGMLNAAIESMADLVCNYPQKHEIRFSVQVADDTRYTESSESVSS
jgi:hypothetical protein